MSVNKVILVGRLGRDPEIRYMPNQDPVATFSLATNEFWKDKDGQRKERTQWHNIVLFRSLANIAQQYLKKGNLVYIDGKIQSRKYLSKEGVEKVSYEIIGENLKMLGTKSDNNIMTESDSIIVDNNKDNLNKQNNNDVNLDNVSLEDLDDDIPF